MYKKLLALCLAALLTASAAGCSQGTEGSSAPAEGGSAPAGDAAPKRAFPAGKSHSGRRVPLVLPCHHLLHVYPEVLRAGNRHVWNQELNPGPGTGFPALQY